MSRRLDREGMILLNVLLVVATGSVAVLIMVAGQDIEIQRSARLRDVTQAGAYAQAGELSAITTLRRDGIVAAGTDNLSEPWAALGQKLVSVPGGAFALSIEDEQGRFNLNSLGAEGSPAALRLLQRIGGSVRVSPESLNRIALVVRRDGPLRDEASFLAAGVPAADLDRLAPFVTLLPVAARINLNTVGEPLLALMLQDATAARALISRRDQAGFLTPADLGVVGADLPAAGYTSDHFRVVTTVTFGEVTEVLESRLARVRGSGSLAVVVESRRRTAG